MESLLFPILSLGGLGLIFGVILGYASKKLAVPVDPRVPLIKDVLPSANCGGCGFAGCDAYAQAVATEGAAVSLCPVGGATVAEKIGEIMGITVDMTDPKKAFIKCQGTLANAKEKYKYVGPQTCLDAANLLGGGPKGCMYGCLGMGSCENACPFGSIHMINGIAVVDENTCTGCGICVKICPKRIIELTPISKRVRVTCSSKLKGVLDVKTHCTVGCIACGICAKVCPSGAIELVNNLPIIDYDKCTQCDVCVQKCPTKAILHVKKECPESN